MNHVRLEPGRRFARGIWEGDKLPAVNLGVVAMPPETGLTLSYMELGDDPQTGPSWLARMLKLRDSLGPFRLSFLKNPVAHRRLARERPKRPYRTGGRPIFE